MVISAGDATPYTRQGRLKDMKSVVEDHLFIYECNAQCACVATKDCGMRVVQNVLWLVLYFPACVLVFMRFFSFLECAFISTVYDGAVCMCMRTQD